MNVNTHFNVLRVRAYHVWVECWMKREEVSTIGWNLIDCSTTNGPVSGIGPIPVKVLHDSSNKTYSNNDISRISSMIHSEVSLHGLRYIYEPLHR